MKAHLAFSDSPIGTGSRAMTACKKEILSTKAVFMWDTTAVGSSIEYPLGVCRECLRAAGETKNKNRVYCYGLESK